MNYIEYHICQITIETIRRVTYWKINSLRLLTSNTFTHVARENTLEMRVNLEI